MKTPPIAALCAAALALATAAHAGLEMRVNMTALGRIWDKLPSAACPPADKIPPLLRIQLEQGVDVPAGSEIFWGYVSTPKQTSPWVGYREDKELAIAIPYGIVGCAACGQNKVELEGEFDREELSIYMLGGTAEPTGIYRPCDAELKTCLAEFIELSAAVGEHLESELKFVQCGSLRKKGAAERDTEAAPAATPTPVAKKKVTRLLLIEQEGDDDPKITIEEGEKK